MLMKQIQPLRRALRAISGDPNMNLKAMILAAVATLSLGVGAVYAQGAPSGFQPPVYGPSDSGHYSRAGNLGDTLPAHE
jgi:hypothetical protein